MSDKDIQIQSKPMFDPQLWSAWRTMAETFVKSKALPSTIDNPEKVILVLQAAHDYGMTVSEALKGFYFVNGQMTVWGEVAIAQMTKKGYKVEWGVCDDTTATCTITSQDGRTATETYTLEEAKKAGLTAKGMWAKYPKNMLRFKAFGMCKRFSFPEVMSGMYTKEDMEGEVIDVTEAPAKPATISAILEQLREKKVSKNWMKDHFGVASRELLLQAKKTDDTVLTENDAKSILKELMGYSETVVHEGEVVDGIVHESIVVVGGASEPGELTTASTENAPSTVQIKYEGKIPAGSDPESLFADEMEKAKQKNLEIFRIKASELKEALKTANPLSDDFKKMTAELASINNTLTNNK